MTLLALLLAVASDTVVRWLTVDGRLRYYTIHVPDSVQDPAPVVLVFHGGGGTPANIERETRFSRLSERHGFIAVYPRGVEGHFNDGRDYPRSRAHRENIDDVGFVRSVLEDVERQYRLDPARIFATGLSNGAIFAQRLAAEASDRIVAIAAVAGGMAPRVFDDFAPDQPVSILMIHGMADWLTRFEGGLIPPDGGTIRGVPDLMEAWATRDGCFEGPVYERLPNIEPDDHTEAWLFAVWGGDAGTDVSVIGIDNGGHTWPGGTQYLPWWLIGRVCRDFDASEVIWDYFESHPRPG